MTKSQQQTRGIARKGGEVAIEQHTIVDDNLLPSAEELEKLKQIDPAIIEWILRRTEKEQDTRLKYNTDNMQLAHKDIGITRTSLWLAFILAIATLSLAALFIYLGKEVAGTIFGSVGILVIIQSFLKFGRK